MLPAELPVVVNLRAYRGDSWTQEFRLLTDVDTPLDLSGATVAAQALGKSGSQTRLDLAAQILEAPGSVAISLPADAKAGAYSYDLQVADGGTVTTWVRGQLTVDPDVTALP